MALATYADLKTSVQTWLHRTDLAAQVTDFIALAESRLNRVLRLRVMEVDTALTATPNSRFLPLPSDYNQPVALWLESFTPRRELQQRQPQMLAYRPVQTFPNFWAIDGAQIALDRLAGAAYPFTFRYQKILSLAAGGDDGTNWLLTNHPDAYLFAALLEATPYIRDDGRMALWQDRYDRCVKEIQANQDRSQAFSLLGVEVAARQRLGRFNMIEG